jgi:uncharacterized membrane-anchored protein
MQSQNLPTIDARYWAAIVAASMCGANTGDFAAHYLHMGHTGGLLPLAAIFAVILWAERRNQRPTEFYYWLAIIVVRTAATNLADLATHDLKLGYITVELGLAGLMVVVLFVDRLWIDTNKIADGSGRNLPAADAIYWVVMLAAGTLGTALGDWVADDIGLGLAVGSIVLVVVLGVVLQISMRPGRMTKPWYWLSIVAARTAGTTLGDLVASRHGLNFGLPLSTLCTSLLLIGILTLWKSDRAARLSEA